MIWHVIDFAAGFHLILLALVSAGFFAYFIEADKLHRMHGTESAVVVSLAAFIGYLLPLLVAGGVPSLGLWWFAAYIVGGLTWLVVYWAYVLWRGHIVLSAFQEANPHLLEEYFISLSTKGNQYELPLSSQSLIDTLSEHVSFSVAGKDINTYTCTPKNPEAAVLYEQAILWPVAAPAVLLEGWVLAGISACRKVMNKLQQKFVVTVDISSSIKELGDDG